MEPYSKEAVKIFLEEKREEGGEDTVQQNWKRIWNGYVTWATVGFSGEGLAIRRLLLDRKSINVGTTDEPECAPNFKDYHRQRMTRLIQRKAQYGSQVHGAASVGGSRLNDLFGAPEMLMSKMIDAGYFDLESPRDSKFFNLLEFDGPMYKIFTEEDVDTILDWIESLRTTNCTCIEPISDSLPPTSSTQELIEIIRDVGGRAQRAHDELTLPNEAGVRVSLGALFSEPAKLMGALVRGGWVVPYAPDRSMLVTRLFENGGPMEGEISVEQLVSLKRWIQEGANLTSKTAAPLDKFISVSVETTSGKISLSFAEKRQFIGQGCVH